MALTGVCFIVLRRIVGSPFGRMLTAIRENPERAEFVGLNVRLYQIAAFAVAGAFAGSPGRSSASSTAASFRISPTGRSPRRC